jgi:hypothetical protein
MDQHQRRPVTLGVVMRPDTIDVDKLSVFFLHDFSLFASPLRARESLPRAADLSLGGGVRNVR